MNKLGRIFNHKRILGVILSLAVVTGLLLPLTGVFAANAASIAVTTPGSTYVQPGASSVSVVLKVTTDDVWFGWGFDSLTYDTSKLQCTTTAADINTHSSSAYTGDVFNANSKTANGAASATVDNTSAPGAVAGVAWALTGNTNSLPQVTGGTVLTLTFSVKSTAALGDTTISINGPAVSTISSSAYPNITSTNLTLHIVQNIPPTITSVSPLTNVGNGDTVTITGANLNGATAVTFGGVAGVVVGTSTATSVTAKVAGTPPAGNVIVTAQGGASNAFPGFTYQAGSIISLSPAPPATISPGASLVITGTHLTNASQVTFGTLPATVVAVTSANTTQTTVTVTVPNLGATANGITVSVTTPDGPLTNALVINYIGASVTGFTPTTGYPGDTVTITGSGFTAATGVTFGGTPAASYSKNSDTSITAVVDGGATGPVGVQIGSATVNSTASFNYKAVTLFIVPGSQPVNLGSTVTVTLNINTGDTLGTKQVRGWQSDISFDPSTLQCTGITVGTFFSNWFANNPTTVINGSTQSLIGGPAINNATGKITNFGYIVNNALTPAGLTQGASGSGVLATLTFTAIKSVVSSNISPTNVSVADQNSNPIAGAQGNGGAVTVNYANPSPVTGTTTVDSTLRPQLTLFAPNSISGWNLVVSTINSVQRTMNVFANTGWQVTVSADTDGHMTKYNGNYVTPYVELSNPLEISSDAGSGTGGGAGMGNQINVGNTSVLLATGNQYGQNLSNGGDMRNVFFTQPVTYTDPTITSGFTYHIVVTFTASSTSY